MNRVPPYIPPHIPFLWDKAANAKLHDDTYQVTVWGHPYDVVETPLGQITYKRWLEIESVRWMEANLRDSWLREDKEGLVALFSHRKYMKEVLPET